MFSLKVLKWTVLRLGFSEQGSGARVAGGEGPVREAGACSRLCSPFCTVPWRRQVAGSGRGVPVRGREPLASPWTCLVRAEISLSETLVGPREAATWLDRPRRDPSPRQPSLRVRGPAAAAGPRADAPSRASGPAASLGTPRGRTWPRGRVPERSCPPRAAPAPARARGHSGSASRLQGLL